MDTATARLLIPRQRRRRSISLNVLLLYSIIMFVYVPRESNLKYRRRLLLLPMKRPP